VAEEAHSVMLTPAMVRHALMRAHPETLPETLDEFCRRAFGSKWQRARKVNASLHQVRRWGWLPRCS
jgi:hypothetical protein